MTPEWERNEKERAMAKVLEEVAAELGAKSVQSGTYLALRRFPCSLFADAVLYLTIPVAIAYVMQKQPYVFPIIGGRKVEHMLANIEALEIALTDAQIAKIEAVSPCEPRFPATLIVSLSFSHTL